MIEGNSDANLKEIFEASAYFTPKEYKYATNGETEYHLVACDYKKGDKKASYALVFQANKDKHMELVELYKDDEKVDKKDFDGFYKKLYKTKENVKKGTKKADNTSQSQDYYFKPGRTYSFTTEKENGLLSANMILNKDNSIQVTVSGEYMDGNEVEPQTIVYTNDEASRSSSNHVFANKEYISSEWQMSMEIVPNPENDPNNPYLLKIYDGSGLYDENSADGIAGTYYEYFLV